MFHRLIMPDGYSVSLDKFQGLNQIGETGLRDQVNHHYLQVFGVSLAIGAIAGFSQANTQLRRWTRRRRTPTGRAWRPAFRSRRCTFWTAT